MLDSWLDIRPVPDDPETLRPFVTEDEWNAATVMKPAARRSEWLAWRAAVRERLGRDILISYDANGAPVLEEGRGFLGVSHTKGRVAVVWSPEKCAVDMEPVSRDVSRTSQRFLSDDENGLADAANPLFAISAWCAKEALYKFAGIPGLDFKQDIRIVSSDLAAGRMTGTVKGGDPIGIRMLFRDGFVCAVMTRTPELSYL